MISPKALPCVALLALSTGCVETAVYDKTAAQLDLAQRAGAAKDQQIRGLEWQVAVLAQQVRDAELRSAAAQRELAAQIKELAAANAGLTERIKAEQEARSRLGAAVPGDASPGKRALPDDLRRLAGALDAQHARLLERLGKLEQKLDARPAGDPSAPRAARPERTVDEVVDPWGFGSRR